MPRYSTDWFARNKIVFDKYLDHLKGQPSLMGLEIGVYEGMSSNWLLENVLTDPQSILVAMDVFDQANGMSVMNIKTSENLYKENIAPYLDKVIIKKGPSQILLRQEDVNNPYDFIYIDGSHDHADLLEDMVLSWRLLKKGGIMICDDYPWSMYVEKENKVHIPCIGMYAFMMGFEGQFDELYKKEVLVLRKK